MNNPLTLMLALVLAVATAGAGCLGASDVDTDPDTAAAGDGADPNDDGHDHTHDDSGASGSGDAPTVVNDAPDAVIRITDDQDPANETRRGFKGDVLKFSGTNSTDPDGFIANWTWTVVEPMGEEGEPATTTYYGEVVSGVQFGTEGVKVITLTVTDNLGETASASTMYYRDVSYSYGGEFRWTMASETVTETREHKFPVFPGAAVIAASIQIDGAKAEIALLDPSGTEHVKGETETNNVTIVMDHGAPEPGEWTLRVTVTYEPSTEPCARGVCAPGSLPFATAHEAAYGAQGIAWYGEAPAELKPAGDGHGDHDH